MHSMLKKSLLAMTVAAASVASVQAQVITPTATTVVPFNTAGPSSSALPVRISSEGLAIQETISIAPTANLAAGAITTTFTLESNVTINSVVRLVIAGADVQSGSAPTLTSPGRTFSSLGFDESGAAIFNADTALVAADVLTLGGITLENVTGAVTVQGSTILSGNNIVTNTTPVTTIATVNSQFALGDGSGTMNRRFDGVIDVEQLRTQFIGNTGTNATAPNNRPDEDNLNDNFFVSINSAQTDAVNTTVETATIAVTGEDLGFLNTTNTAGETVLDTARFLITSVLGAPVGTGTAAPSLEGNTLTGSVTSDPGSYIGVALRPEGAAGTDPAQLSAQNFTADLDVQYDLGGTNGTINSDGINAGEWTLSGATVNIPWMPYSNNIAQVIRLSNDGTVDGDIELTAFDDEGESYGPVTLNVTAAPGASTTLAQAVAEALAAEGFDGSGSVDLTLVVNSPAADIEVVANYRVLSANDRVSVTVINP